MLPTNEIHTLFRRTSVFDGLSDAEVDAFAGFLLERRVPEGEHLFHEGDPGDSLFVLLAGDVAVDVRGTHGDPLRVGRLGPGDVIGEQACIDPAPRSATVIATSNVLVVELTRTSLDRMSRELPRVASLLLGVIIQELTERLRGVDRRIDAELGVKAPPPTIPPPVLPVAASAWQRLAARFRGAP